MVVDFESGEGGSMGLFAGEKVSLNNDANKKEDVPR